MIGKILALNISEKKGVVKSPVDSVTFKEDYGIIGDAHGGPGKRQVSLLGQESVDKMKESGIKGLCHGIFAENITTQGITLYELPVGTKLKIGETIHEVSQIGKECHKGCEIMKKVGECIMPKEGIFTIVLKGGVVTCDDVIEVIETT